MLITSNSHPNASMGNVVDEMIKHNDYYNVIFVDASIPAQNITEFIALYNIKRQIDSHKDIICVEFGSKYNPEQSQPVISTGTEKDFIQSLINLYDISKNNFIMVKSRFEGESGEKIKPVIERNEIVSGFSYTHQADTYKTTYCYSSLVKSILVDIGRGEKSMMDVLQRCQEHMKQQEINRLEAMNVLSSNQPYKAMGLLASSATVSDANLAPDVNSNGAQLPSSSLDKDISSFMQI